MSVRSLLVFVALVALWAAGGCKPTLVCEGQQNCPADFACVDGGCRARGCFSNSDCEMEQFCDLEPGQCEPGCTTDRDCYYGATCSGGACVDKPCTSTALDCDAGQFCDVFTGQCFDAAGPYCQECTSDSQCGGGNNECFYVSGEGPFCLPECDLNHPCPAGYDCVSISSGGSTSFYVCATLCHYINGVQTQREGAARPVSGAEIVPVGASLEAAGAR